MRQVSPDGTVYDGDWANGFRDGYGVVTLKGPAGKQVKQYAGTFKGGRKWVRPPGRNPGADWNGAVFSLAAGCGLSGTSLHRAL